MLIKTGKNNIIILLTLMCLQCVTAQNHWKYIQIDSTKQKWGDWDKPEWLRYFGLDAGDVDRDGNQDIVSGRYIYHNPGGDMEDSWKRTVLDDNLDILFFTDVDKDPYADLIAQSLPNLYWLEAIDLEGTKYRKHKIGEIPATSHVNSQGFEKAQIITGGLTEFVIAGNGNIYCVEIPLEAPEKNTWKIKKICENTSDEGIGIGDIDNDGDLDIAAGRRPENENEPTILVWFENPGNINIPWKETRIGVSEHPIDRINISHLNKDAKADIVITEERYPGLEPDANMFLFIQKSVSDWERRKIVQQYSMNNLDVQDLDKDGNLDLITNEHKGKNLELQIWYNDGDANFTKKTIDTGKENHLGTKLKDLDGDGDLDIYGAGWDQHQFMHVWRNESVRSLKTGDIFREYPWTPQQTNEKGKFLRVGGNLDYRQNSDHYPKNLHDNGSISLGYPIDLENAFHAEVIIERVQSHEDTKNLSISFNNNAYHIVPEPSNIPERATDYMFHTNIRIPIPLSDLISGDKNIFQLKVDKEQAWNWPQNLIYGIILRVYYTKDKAEFQAEIEEIDTSDIHKEKIHLRLKSPKLTNIAKVDYFGFYEDVNWNGDGVYRSWQFDYQQGKIQNHIGFSSAPPFDVYWSTQWIPDQYRPIKLIARVETDQGLIFMTPEIDNLILKRNYQVFLAKPYQQPPFWVTRNGEHNSYVNIPFSVPDDSKARLYWKSWSPCYNKGIRINDYLLKAQKELPCYDSYWHTEDIEKPEILKKDKNIITTLKTPLENGKMVHGMEVQWPGIMMKLRYKKNNITKTTIEETFYENRSHFVIHTSNAVYYYDKSGGGFSRIIDPYGNDWIQFKKDPWNQYPASAASSYRGIPNLVFGSNDNGAGHPGFDKCTSQVINDTTIVSTSISGKWKWQWTFFDSYAVLEILKTDPQRPYWFLYEGTPGGVYDIKNYYYGTNLGGPVTDLPDLHKNTTIHENYQWAYFGRNSVKNTLFVTQLVKDEHQDMIAYLGNSENGNDSTDGMTVFGFGRGKKTNALLTDHQKFVVGMYPNAIFDKEEHKKLSKYIVSLMEKIK